MKKVILVLTFFTTTLQAMSLHDLLESTLAREMCSELALAGINIATGIINKSTNNMLVKAIHNYPDYATELHAHENSEMIINLNLIGSFIAIGQHQRAMAILLTAKTIYALHDHRTKIYETINRIEKKHTHAKIVSSSQEAIAWINKNHPAPEYLLIKN